MKETWFKEANIPVSSVVVDEINGVVLAKYS